MEPLRLRRFLLIIIALAMPSGVARAQTAEAVQAQCVNNMLTMRDVQANRLLISPNNQTVVNGTTLTPVVQFVPTPDGFDLTIIYNNTTATDAPLGNITVPGIRFGSVIRYGDFRSDASFATANNQGREFFGFGYNYPSLIYSPVFVLGDDSVTIGLSLKYPVLEYNHEVQIQLISPGGMYSSNGRNWEVWFRLQGSLPPGETRTYSLSARVAPASSEWVRTLVPYRDYFRSLYGNVRYTRNPHPVSGLVMNDPGCQSDQNPLGFCSTAQQRPDIAGWGPYAQFFRGRSLSGYSRMMLWRPTGLFRLHEDLNFPFQFMTHMNEVPAMHASLAALRAVPSASLEMGYWWGHSALYMDGWDTGHSEQFNPNNPVHRGAALAEFDMAVGLGAGTIGMDAFVGLSPRDGFDWLQTLLQRAPGIKLITEREWGAPDIYHLLAPTTVVSVDVTTPKVLADLLLPGHETWCGVMANVLAQRRGHTISSSERLAEISRVAQLGYVPVVFDDFRITGGNYNASESWLTSIPADVRDSDGGGNGSNSAGGGQGGGSGSQSGTGGSGSGGSGSGSGAGQSNGASFLSPPGGARSGGISTGGGGGGGAGGGGGGSGGGGGGGGGTSSFSGGAGGLGGSGSGVTTVHGGGKSPGPSALTILDAGGSRVSMPTFTHEEVEAAIQRAKGSVFDQAAGSQSAKGAANPPKKPVASADGK
jgi:hypothetical protein